LSSLASEFIIVSLISSLIWSLNIPFIS